METDGWQLSESVSRFIVAALGSIAIDEVVFKNDIGLYVARIKEKAIQQSKDEAAIDFMKLHDYNTLKSQLILPKPSIMMRKKQ